MPILELRDFSGGITDNVLGGPHNKAREMDNLVVTANQKLRSRPGSEILDSANYQLPDGAVRIGTLLPLGANLIQHYGQKFYVTDGMSELVGPVDGNHAFELGTTSGWLNWGEKDSQLYIVPSEGSLANSVLPVRVYADENDTLQLRTAGLPWLDDETANFDEATALAEMISVANGLRAAMTLHYTDVLATAMTLANELKTDMNAHRSVRHTTGTQAAISSANATTLATLITLCREMNTWWNTHVADAKKASGRAYHPAQTVSIVYGAIDSSYYYDNYPRDLSSCFFFLQDLKFNYNAHDNDATPHSGATPLNQTTTAVGTQASQHRDQDAVALAIIAASSAATNFDTLVELVDALTQAYDIHQGDATKSAPKYHYRQFYAERANPDTSHARVLSSTLATVTRAEDYRALYLRLNDLKSCYEQHLFTVESHAFLVDYLTDPAYYTAAPLTNVATYGASLAEDYTAYYRVANTLKNALNAHKSRQGSTSSDVHTDITESDVDYVTSPDATTPTTLFTLIAELTYAYQTHTNLTTVGSYEEYSNMHAATTDLFPLDDRFAWPFWTNALPPSTGRWSEARAYLNEIATKYNQHQASQTPHKNNSQSTNLDPIVVDELEVGNYIWALHYEYTYRVGSIEYVDRGPLHLIQGVDISTIEQQPATIQNIPALVNGYTANYDTANVRVRIARTPKNGSTTFYYVGDIPNGTSQFIDTTSDERLVQNEPLYTSAGVVENEPPPMAKAFHVMDDLAYYGNVVIDGEYLPTTVVQSIPGDHDSVSATFTVRLADPVTLISSANSRPVVVTEKKTYRLEGGYDIQGQGALTHEAISETSGSLCPQSAVQAEGGVFYFGLDGVYFTDAFRVVKLNEDWPITYQTLVDTATKRNRIQGTFDVARRLVIWSVQWDSGNSENDGFLILDLRWGIRPDATFYSWSNGTDFRPSAVGYFQGDLLRADSRGYVFRHDDALKYDYKVNTAANPSTWAKKAITYDWESVGIDFGTQKNRKWNSSVHLTLKNEGNLSLQVKAKSDDRATWKELKPIRYRSQYTGIVKEERNMAAGILRPLLRHVQLTNALVIIENSDTLGQASVNKVTKQVTLDSAVTQDWPVDAVDWYIAFEKKNLGAGNVDDGYETLYPVTIRGADTLTFTDSGNTCPSGSVKWVLKGTPKDERMELQTVALPYEILGGDLHAAFQASETGANE